ncbi:WD40-repeat-containing domain protein [Gamsiella multidivaricata]|uniref:WD40-repeat-containing domain protein n=1 Tax=Gamsiella multidivaricata TaxID=101098 RepID=UPI00222036A1|nr:WD40-repeat-containing domain protein [Gamsiella multidivaricata]KAG0370709.1 Transcription factor spt8 [Gamsiella multidivaricata]KAI7826156.1 WD40-repeat-containing domain protein [Gamsiella multidivaricata]
MDSEHESEDEFTQNDDNRTDDGSDRGEADDDTTVNAAPSTQPDESAAETTAVRTHTPLILQPNVLDCKSFDIMPCVLAVHPCNIYCMAATQCMRWVFTGSEDGYIRKYDFFASMNGKTMLTQGQRHGQVDSVTKAGILTSYWENEEQPIKVQPILGEDGLTMATPGASSSTAGDMDITMKQEDFADRATLSVTQQQPLRATSPFGEESKMSAVYSLDCHSEAVFALSGLESGSINLWTPRHEEGTCHHVFRQHTAPVSAIKLTPDQQGFISGSWDHSVLQWDLNNGAVVRTYGGHGSQISSLNFQPTEMPVATMDMSSPTANCSNDAVLMSTSVDGMICLWDRRDPTSIPRKLMPPEKVPPWCLSACWSADGKRIYCGRRNGTVDEWDFAEGRFIQSIRMPANSGPVSFVKCMPNNKHLVCASQDNIRLWNITELGSKSSLRPFQIIAGHHGGLISNVHIDPTCKYMITTSGNREWEGPSTNGCLFYDIQPLL